MQWTRRSYSGERDSCMTGDSPAHKPLTRVFALRASATLVKSTSLHPRGLLGKFLCFAPRFTHAQAMRTRFTRLHICVKISYSENYGARTCHSVDECSTGGLNMYACRRKEERNSSEHLLKQLGNQTRNLQPKLICSNECNIFGPQNASI